jgi:NADPH-dependent curcumin reductase CurA
MTENVCNIIQSFTSALQGLFSSDNIGKTLVKVLEESPKDSS